MWILLCVTASLLLNFVSAGNNSFVLSPKIVELCKEHTCRDGYGYKSFYRVDSEDLKQIKKDYEIAFEMHIGIQASSDGHILLSPVLKPGEFDAVYEIVVGGGSNKFTEIRRNIKKNAKTSVMTPNILSPFEMRGFYIRISQDGIIEFGNEGDVLPLLSFKDINPLEIKYFSFSAWFGTVAKFLYDCPDKNLTEPSMDSEEVEISISPSDQLKRTQLMYRLPWISPKPNMEVSLGIKVTSVKYHAAQSKLVTGVSVVISWTDETMGWYPPKFNGTKSIKFRPGQIWRPKFYVFNSDTGVFDSKNSGVIKVLPSGEATFHFQTKIHTWCYDGQTEYNKWPHDEYACSIVIQPWEVHDKISIKIMDSDDSRMQIYADIDTVVENEWAVTSKQTVIEASIWNEVYMNDDNGTHQSDRLVISLDLARRPTTYNIVFYTPLVVLLVFVLMSFWTETLTMARIWFYAGCVIVITMGLCYIDYLMPCYTMPSILVLYITVLAGVVVALLIQSLLMMSVTEKLCNLNAMHKIFRWNAFRNIFCLPNVKTSENGGYMIQDDEEADNIVPKGSNVEEMDRENHETQNKVKELAEVIDRVLFFVYTITFSVMLASHF